MKYHPACTTINLQQLINRLISLYQPVANSQNSYFTSSAGHRLYVKTDAESLGTLLGSLFYIVARCSRDTPIMISAACYNNRAAISLQCSSKADSYRIIYGFQHLGLLSDGLNGSLDISNYGNRETTITFNFANHSVEKNLPLPKSTEAFVYSTQVAKNNF